MSTVKMTNKELYETYVSLKNFQAYEKSYFDKTGERLLKGRVKISYAIEKNLHSIINALSPRDAVLSEIFSEYRDLDAEKQAIEEEKKLAQQQGRSVNPISEIFREGKSRKEYEKEIQKLSQIEVELEIFKISVELFDGIEIDSSDLGTFMFMLE